MISRLDLTAIQPKVIVEVGNSVGGSSGLLKKRYPDATVLTMDATLSFLQYAKQNQQVDKDYLCASAEQLPLKEYDIDLVFANLFLPWCHDINAVLLEWQRVLKPNGLLMFSTLGPDTLREVPSHLLQLIDMHNVGDAMVHAGFLDPVMDVDYLTLTYRSRAQLIHELQATGSLPSDIVWLDSALLPDAENLFPVTYEIVYGHAWGQGAKPGFSADSEGEVRIPLSAIKRGK